MRIDGKIPQGYVLLCGCSEAFVLPRIGIAVECPACGRTQLGAEIAAEYHLRRSHEQDEKNGPAVEATATV